MSQAFISYHPAERKLARKIAHRVAYAGFGVWWDREDKQGDRWSEAVTMALSRSDAVLVLWSKKSVRSPRILGEATAAFGRSVLISVLIDGTPAPPPFDSAPTVDAEGWDGDADELAWMRLQEHLTAMLSQVGPDTRAARMPRRPLEPLYPSAPPLIPDRGGPGPLAFASLVAVVALGAAGWTYRERLPSPAEGLDWARDRFGELRARAKPPAPPASPTPMQVRATATIPPPPLTEDETPAAAALADASTAAQPMAPLTTEKAPVAAAPKGARPADRPLVAPPAPPRPVSPPPLYPLDESIASADETPAPPKPPLETGLY